MVSLEINLLFECELCSHIVLEMYSLPLLLFWFHVTFFFTQYIMFKRTITTFLLAFIFRNGFEKVFSGWGIDTQCLV